MKYLHEYYIVIRLACVLLCIMLISSCSSQKYIPEGLYLLDKVSISADNPKANTGDLSNFITQHPNNKWFSALKVPMGIYMMGGTSGKSRTAKMFRRMGEAPVIYDSVAAVKTQNNLLYAVRNHGFMHATVQMKETMHKHKIRVAYNITSGPRWYVRDIMYDIQDSTLLPVLDAHAQDSRLYQGMPFDANILDSERSRIVNQMQHNGYYRFNKDFIHFEVDSTIGNNQVDIILQITKYQTASNMTESTHTKYRIGDITFGYDTVMDGQARVRDKVIARSVMLQTDKIYDETDVQDTYGRISMLKAIAAANINMTESVGDSSVLDTKITLIPNKLNSIKLNLDGTNSAGDFGAALQLTYQNRNVFHGSEVLTLKARTAFEAIRKLAGYPDQNYVEYGFEAGLEFPDFKFPFLSRDFRKKILATSEVALMFNSQDRPEFHRRVVTGSWRYRWNKASGKFQHRIDLLDLNYVYMPWISDTFRKKYLDDPTSRNAILRYIYENLFIMKWGYQFVYSSIRESAPIGLYGKDGYTIRFAAETAGNLLQAINALSGGRKNADGHYVLFNVAYAQYAKFDFDFSRSIRFNANHSLALHFALGVAYPYGNATILPYEKRYFAGGANSVRGWEARSLGPGSFMGSDGNIDFINQTGDMKLDMNVEYRAHLFWKLDGTLFVDAGNIWTLREYKEQPGGQFGWGTCWRQIAVAYGAGLRLNLNYFLLRFDAGMKAINPAYLDNYYHYPIIHPNFKRDFSFHFAVGLPF